jgi:hypothetical protein
MLQQPVQIRSDGAHVTCCAAAVQYHFYFPPVPHVLLQWHGLLQAGQGTTDRYGFCIKMGPMDQVRPPSVNALHGIHADVPSFSNSSAQLLHTRRNTACQEGGHRCLCFVHCCNLHGDRVVTQQQQCLAAAGPASTHSHATEVGIDTSWTNCAVFCPVPCAARVQHDWPSALRACA